MFRSVGKNDLHGIFKLIKIRQCHAYFCVALREKLGLLFLALGKKTLIVSVDTCILAIDKPVSHYRLFSDTVLCLYDHMRIADITGE